MATTSSIGCASSKTCAFCSTRHRSRLPRRWPGLSAPSVEAADSGPPGSVSSSTARPTSSCCSRSRPAAACTRSCWMATLHLITLEGIGDAGAASLGHDSSRGRHRDQRGAGHGSVEATGWDPSRSETRTATASAARVGRDVSAEVSPDDVGGSGERVLVDEPVPDQERATRSRPGRARRARRRRGHLLGSGLRRSAAAPGNADRYRQRRSRSRRPLRRDGGDPPHRSRSRAT